MKEEQSHSRADRSMQPAHEGGLAPAKTPSQGWEEEAEHFAAWARTPGHDAYWYYSSAFFDFLPPPGKATLEIGCGEGRVCRDLAARGHHVTGVDAAPTLVRLAQEADSTGMYVVADAAALPFEAGTFDLAVAYNALMDIEDMPGAVREAARVLEPGGHFCVCLTHPMADAGMFATEEADAPFVITGSYLTRRWTEKTVERDGLQMTFRSWAYPLEGYARALETAGFFIEAIREPAAPPSALAARPGYARWQRLPMFLHLRAVRL